MLIALVIACSLGLGLFGSVLLRLTPRAERRVACGCLLATLPAGWVMLHGMRIPLDAWLHSMLGDGELLNWIRTAYAPLTEEPAKLWPLALPQVRRAITQANVSRFALALGLGFALGEMVTVANLIVVRTPEIARLPWYQLGGFISERLMTCAIHSGLTAIALTLWRWRSRFMLGLFLAMLAHYLANFPIAMSHWGWLGTNAIAVSLIINGCVLLCFVSSIVGLVWLHFGRLHLGAWLYGRARCPGCGLSYERSLWGVNLGVSRRYERCPHCRRWHLTTAAGMSNLG